MPALMPWSGRQVEAGRPKLEWPGSLPPEQVWEVQTEEEEVPVGARDPGLQTEVDPPGLAKVLLAALREAIILGEF